MSEQTQETCAHKEEILTCTSITSQYADVSVPLNVKPYALVGKVETECCGEPLVTMHICQGAACSCGCEITITQTICMKIPLKYGADACIGDTTTVCKHNSQCAGNIANVHYR